MSEHGWRHWSSTTHLISMAAFGVVAAIVTGLLAGWLYSPIAGWIAASGGYSGWVWITIAPMDADETSRHATREDPRAPVADLVLIFASLASLATVALVLIFGSSGNSGVKAVMAVLAVTSVALSWLLIHTLFTVRYARLYYHAEDGGISFNQDDPPSYGDFAYLAFTLGMTFQVSDTSIQNHTIRMTALRHGLLSYLFGSVILATVINLISGLTGA